MCVRHAYAVHISIRPPTVEFRVQSEIDLWIHGCSLFLLPPRHFVRTSFPHLLLFFFFFILCIYVYSQTYIVVYIYLCEQHEVYSKCSVDFLEYFFSRKNEKNKNKTTKKKKKNDWLSVNVEEGLGKRLHCSRLRIVAPVFELAPRG